MSNLPTPLVLDEPEGPGQARFRLMLSALAREIVMEQEGIPAVLARKGITNTQYEKILKNPYYIKIFEEAREAWHAASNAAERTRLHAQFLTEHALPGYFVRLTDPKEPLPAVTEGMKLLMKTAGLGEQKNASDTGGKFVISINLGSGKTIEHEVKTIEQPTSTPTETSNAPRK